MGGHPIRVGEFHMTRFHQRPLVFAICTALALAIASPVAVAQQQDDKPLSAREKRAQRMAELAKGKDKGKQAEEVAQLYPNATRTSPDAKANPKVIKQLQAMQEAYEKDDFAGVLAKADEIAANSAAGAYDKAYAFSIAGNAAANMDNEAKAGEYFAKAVEANGLDNNSHYSTMFNLAVIQYGNEQYAESLATMDRFLAETKSQDAKHLGLRAGLLGNLERHAEAAAIYKDLVAKNPDDKRVLMNAVSALQNSEKFSEANQLLQDAYGKGLLTESRELRALYVGYMNDDRWDDAQKVIEDGVAKGVLQPSPELARDYQVLAQNAYIEDKIPLAISLYEKAAPMAADGEAYLNLAKVLDFDGKKAAAKAAAQKALDKGVKKPEEAKALLAR